MKRTTIDNRNWSSGQSDMVCSEHFVDGIPTAENPYPTLGFRKHERAHRRELVRREIVSASSASGQPSQADETMHDHSYFIS